MKQKILIVENEELLRRYMISCVVPTGNFDVLEANNLLTAIEITSQHQPLVILFDLMLQDTDPLAFIKQIRSIASDYYPYVILTSIIKDDKLTKLAYAYGADYYLEKNFKCFELSGILQNILRQYNNARLLTENELRYRSLFNLAAEPMLLIQLDNFIITEANAAARSVFGFTNTDKINALLQSVSAKPDELQSYLNQRTQMVLGIRFQHANGKSFIAKAGFDYFQLKGIDHALMSVQDISEILKSVEERDALSKLANQNDKESFKELIAYLAGEENERRRIAAEIHDHVGQLMVSVKLSVENVMLKLKNHVAAADMEKARQQLLEAIWAVRSIAHNTEKGNNSEGSLKNSLEKLMLSVTGSEHLSIEYKWQGSDLDTNQVVISNIYRICEESVNNIIKHASVGTASISVENSTDEFKLEIISKKGNNVINTNGIGMRIMQQRATLIGGEMKIYATENIFKVQFHLNKYLNNYESLNR